MKGTKTFSSVYVSTTIPLFYQKELAFLITDLL